MLISFEVTMYQMLSPAGGDVSEATVSLTVPRPKKGGEKPSIVLLLLNVDDTADLRISTLRVHIHVGRTSQLGRKVLVSKLRRTGSPNPYTDSYSHRIPHSSPLTAAGRAAKLLASSLLLGPIVIHCIIVPASFFPFGVHARTGYDSLWFVRCSGRCVTLVGPQSSFSIRDKRGNFTCCPLLVSDRTFFSFSFMRWRRSRVAQL